MTSTRAQTHTDVLPAGLPAPWHEQGSPGKTLPDTLPFYPPRPRLPPTLPRAHRHQRAARRSLGESGQQAHDCLAFHLAPLGPALHPLAHVCMNRSILPPPHTLLAWIMRVAHTEGTVQDCLLPGLLKTLPDPLFGDARTRQTEVEERPEKNLLLLLWHQRAFHRASPAP